MMKDMLRSENRYRLYSEYFRGIFGERVQKISVNAGFTCPNRDGTSGTGGCTYCDNGAFNPSYCKADKPVTQQIAEGIEFHLKRYRRANQYLVYFQPFSNTYASLGYLEKIYSEALSYPGVAGLVIGTRPDCVDMEKLGLISHIAQQHFVIVEYGIESCYDKTLRRINRGHTFARSEEVIRMTADYGIHAGAHLIFGLPGESMEEMLNEAEIISHLPLKTVKFHQLQIIKGTVMEKEYKDSPGDFSFFSLEEYLDFIIDFTERLNPAFVIERFAGEVPPRFLSGPGWGNIRYDSIVRRIKERMKERDARQGRLFRPL